MLLNAIRISRLKKYPRPLYARSTTTVKNNRELYRCRDNGICRCISLKIDGTVECTCAPSIPREASNVNLEWRRVSPEVVPR